MFDCQSGLIPGLLLAKTADLETIVQVATDAGREHSRHAMFETAACKLDAWLPRLFCKQSKSITANRKSGSKPTEKKLRRTGPWQRTKS